MGLQGIHADRKNFDIPLFQLRHDLGHRAEFRRADRREIFRMREEDAPAVAQPFVKVDRALSGLRRKIRRFVAQP